MNEEPAWLAPSAAAGGGMWPLGLESGGFAIIERLLPGYTNTTVRPRYYAFFAWAFWTWEQRREHTTLSQQQWRERLEMLMRLCTKTRDPELTGLFGNDSVGAVRESADTMLPLFRGYVPSAFVPAAYSSSFGKLGCAIPGEAREEVRLTESVGAPLARAFDRALRQNPACAAALDRWALCDDPEVPAEAVYILKDALALRHVWPGEAEQPVLEDLLLRTRPAGDAGASEADAARTRSLALLLELLAASPAGIADTGVPHVVFATERLPNGSRFEPDPVFAQDWASWQRYQERQFQKVGLYGFWSVLIQTLQGGLSAPTDVVRDICRLLASEPLLHQWLDSEPLAWKVADAREWVRQTAEADEVGPGGILSALSDRVRSRSTARSERAAASLLLLLLVTAWWERVRPSLNPALVQLHRLAGAARLPLDALTREFAGRGAATVEELVRWIVCNIVIGQANRVAMEKIARGEAHVFLLQDERGYRARKGLRHTDYVWYDEPRISSGYRLMEGLGLVESGAGYRITDAGKAALERVREHLRTVHGISDL
jgi:hypothetical protein